MNILKKGVAVILSFGAAFTAYADPGTIKGYFRVQNDGNGKFVEVSGPFTAKPNLDSSEALNSAGTIMYIEAIQNGEAYEVTSLRCQGIDVVGQEVSYEDYESIFDNAGSTQASSLVYGMFQQGFKYGYTTFARATVGSIFLTVAAALDGYQDEETTYSAEELKELVNRFNEQVTATLDLGLRLKPVAGEEKTVQLYFDVPSFQPVSDWYANPENYDIFTAATQAMTKYLMANGKNITLETFYPSDVQLFAEWGYDITSVSGITASEGNYTTTFSNIFSDPELLFNWIKWVGYMILNPDCASAEDHHMENLTIITDKIGNIDFKGHYLTNMLISYLPRLHYNTRAYLINGKVVNSNGDVDSNNTTTWDKSADETLGFANEREMTIAGRNGNWVLVPVDNESELGKFTVKLPIQWTDEDGKSKNYAAVFYDFPVSATSESTEFFTLTDQEESMNYFYVELESQNKVSEQSAFIVSSSETSIQLNVSEGTYTYELLDESLFDTDNKEEVPSGAVQVTDEEEKINSQRVRRKAVTSTNSNFTGVLLATNADRIQDYWNINSAVTPVYSVFREANILSSNHLVFENTGGNLEANQAIYVFPNSRYSKDYVLINAPKIDVSVGETETGEEDEGNDQTSIKIAQGFVGDGANTFEGLISMPADLTYGEDFTIQISAPSATGSDSSEAWATPESSSNINQSYLDAFLQIQPAPSDAGSDYTPGLYTQYLSLFKGHDNVTVDGFFIPTLSASASEGVDDGKGNYSYNLTFNAPCSGIYEMTITGIGDYEGMISGPHKIKIYPNLYGIFGADRGFNINGYSFTKVEESDTYPSGSYVIYFPENYSDDDLKEAVGYIPGTYFTSSLTTNAPNASTIANLRRQANSYTSAYATTMDVSGFVDQNEPLEVTVEKNGVSASYQFYLIKSTTPGNVSTGINAIESESNEEDAVYYNMNGIKVQNPQKGIFVKVQNGKATKVIM